MVMVRERGVRGVEGAMREEVRYMEGGRKGLGRCKDGNGEGYTLQGNCI